VAVTRTRTPPLFEQFFAVRRFAAALSFTADGEQLLFASNISGQFNLWRVPIQGGWPDQLTVFTDETVRGVGVSRDGRILLCADHNGDEFHQLYLLDPERGWPEQLTAEPQVQHFVGSDAWAPDGSKFAYAANARRPSDMECWVRDVESGETRPVFGEAKFSFPGTWSPDGSQLLVIDFRNNSDVSIFLVDVEAGESRELTPHDDEAIFLPGPWAADGSGFYLVTDEGSEFRGLAFYDLGANRWEWVDGEPRHDVEDLKVSADGRVLAWLVNEDGHDRLRLRDLDDGGDLPEPDLPAGARPHLTGAQPPLAVSADGSYAALISSSARRPPEAWVVETGSGRAWPVTDSRIGGPRDDDLVDVELVSYPTFDGRNIPAWLYRPNVEGRAPVVLSIHGGPEAQEKPVYQPIYQYLLSRGIGVLATNIRGSTGYGKSYQRLVQRDWGGGDMQDWEHAVEWLRAQDWVDPDRIGVFGGSYGGFAVLTCVTRLPQYWAAAVDIFGPSNLVTFAKAVPPTWKRFIARFVGDPETEADFLMERSPITYVENVQAPLLVIQGATDPRVVKGESDQLVERLQSLGREVEYIVFDDEGHGFTKRTNELKAYRLAAEWLERHLTAGDRPERVC